MASGRFPRLVVRRWQRVGCEATDKQGKDLALHLLGNFPIIVQTPEAQLIPLDFAKSMETERSEEQREFSGATAISPERSLL